MSRFLSGHWGFHTYTNATSGPGLSTALDDERMDGPVRIRLALVSAILFVIAAASGYGPIWP